MIYMSEPCSTCNRHELCTECRMDCYAPPKVNIGSGEDVCAAGSTTAEDFYAEEAANSGLSASPCTAGCCSPSASTVTQKPTLFRPITPEELEAVNNNFFTQRYPLC